MATERVFVNEVDQPPAFMYTVGDGSRRHKGRKASKVTLAVAKSSKGTVWVPDYLPSGYELSRVNLAPSGEMRSDVNSGHQTFHAAGSPA